MTMDKQTLLTLKNEVEIVRVISGTPVSEVTPDELEFVYHHPLASAPNTETFCRAVDEWLDYLIEEVEING